MQRSLRDMGFNVIVQKSGYGLLNAVAAHRPPLMLIDVMMSSLDRPSVADLVRRDPELRSTKLVLRSTTEAKTLAQMARDC